MTWRRRRTAPSGRLVSAPACERIYHMPSQQFYARTKIDVTQGERWFCTEDEAQAAGWRPPAHGKVASL